MSECHQALLDSLLSVQYGFALPAQWIRPVGEETGSMIAYLAKFILQNPVRVDTFYLITVIDLFFRMIDILSSRGIFNVFVVLIMSFKWTRRRVLITTTND